MEALDRTKSVAASKTLEDGLLPMAGQFDDDDDEVEIHSVHTHDIMPYYYDNRAHTASITSSPVRSQRAIDTLPSTRLPSAQQACASTANGAVAIAVHRQPVEPATPITATVRARFTGDILKAAVCTTFAGCAMLCNLLTLCIIHDYVGRQALPDAVFYLVPQQSWAWRAGDPLVALMVVCTLLLCIMHRHRWVLWRRWMFLLGTLYAMRVLCLAVTQLPASFADNERSCKPKHEGTDVHVVANRFFSQLLMAGLQGNSDGYLCGDLMFSGHTLQYGVNCYMMHRYTPHAWWPVKHLSTLIAATGMVFMVISRSHYTVDVVVAYWLSTGLFRCVHARTRTSTP
jgi:shingomyelin synthase